MKQDPWQRKVLIEFQKAQRSSDYSKSQVNFASGEALVNPECINYSQISVYIDDGHIKMLDQMQKYGWNNQYSIDVVQMQPYVYVSIDNRRLFMAKVLKLKHIKVKIHPKDAQDIESLRARFHSQYPTKTNDINALKTWHDCIRFRMKNQNSGQVPKHGYREFILVKDKTSGCPPWYQ